MLRREFGEIDINPADRQMSPEELEKAVVGRRAVICMPADRIDGHILAAAADCRIFACYSLDCNNIDVAKATRRGILVSTTPGVATHASADMAWVLMMTAARHVLEGDTLVRSGRWRGWGPTDFVGRDLHGQTLGVVGAGRVGTAVALRARGWDMHVLYCDIDHNRKLEAEVDATRVNLDVLLRQSDFVTLHVPLTDKTRHMIGRAQLEAMKSSAVLINTAHGSIVDETALVEALRSGRPGAAGLDVYSDEPRLPAGLAELDNVVLTPGLSSATVLARGMMSELVAAAVISALRGDVASNVVNPEAGKPLPPQ
jgi:lactate dehydrogenase-like 2-hydroxyacid dehydrogenase